MILIAAEKAFGKLNTHPFIKRTLSKVRIEGNIFNLIKVSYKKLQLFSYMILKGQMHFFKIKNKSSISSLTALLLNIHTVTEIKWRMSWTGISKIVFLWRKFGT